MAYMVGGTAPLCPLGEAAEAMWEGSGGPRVTCPLCTCIYGVPTMFVA